MSGRYIPREAYAQIREQVPLAEAGWRYGLQIDRGGRMAHCPFHGRDAHPSMSLHGQAFRCFACGANGSVIDLTAQLLGVDVRAAALRLDEDFQLGLAVDGSRPLSEEEKAERDKLTKQRARDDALLAGLKAWRERTLGELSKYRRELWTIQQTGAPRTPDEAPSEDFVRACLQIDALDDLLDELEGGEMNDIISIFKDRRVAKYVS